MLLFFASETLERKESARDHRLYESFFVLCFFRSAPLSSSRAHLSCFVRSWTRTRGKGKKRNQGSEKLNWGTVVCVPYKNSIQSAYLIRGSSSWQVPQEWTGVGAELERKEDQKIEFKGTVVIEMKVYTASATAPVNIATLKYWGKRDSELNLPTNSSISVTLSQDDLRTLTTASTSEDFDEDKLWLNGKEESLKSKRTQACLADLRRMRLELENKDPTLPRFSQWKLHIVSENNFPTAAGLASSAAGFAALVVAIAKLYELPHSMSELSIVARKGSGSACRSLFGGYVAWEMGKLEDGTDSKAVEILPCDAWSEMKAAILVVSDVKKDTPSTQGMQLTVATSDLFRERVNHVVPKRFEEMKDAILRRDFASFAELTMRDSNSFHATCLDSYPPIFYINDTSKKIIRLVHSINKFFIETIVAYTFDAGPNAVLYYLEKNEEKLFAFLYTLLSQVDGWSAKYSASQLEHFRKLYSAEYMDKIDFFMDTELYKGITRVILTRVGQGPQSSKSHLVDEATGLPLAG